MPDTRNVQIIQGDCREVLKSIGPESVHCVVTSPPYFGLRSYGGGDAELGTEPTPADYIANLVDVFRELWRVMRPDATAWLVLGDSFAGSGKGRNADGTHQEGGKQGTNKGTIVGLLGKTPIADGLKPKDLMMMPHRVAMALQEQGWYVRGDIVWAKRAPMPESVTDRPTRSHEYVFLLAKQERYYYDAAAVAEPSVSDHPSGNGYKRDARLSYLDATGPRGSEDQWEMQATRNLRDVWTLGPEAYAGAHFAVFPQRLAELCILAGTSERGCCPECGAPWKRITQRPSVEPLDYEGKWATQEAQSSGRRMLANVRARREAGEDHDNPFPAAETIGWKPSCSHDLEPVPCTVLDPFAGSGTVGRVALRHRRNAALIELNPEYCELIEKRIYGVQVALPMDGESA